MFIVGGGGIKLNKKTGKNVFLSKNGKPEWNLLNFFVFHIFSSQNRFPETRPLFYIALYNVVVSFSFDCESCFSATDKIFFFKSCKF